jgi:putative glycosyltransferase (TIGR04372 family)
MKNLMDYQKHLKQIKNGGIFIFLKKIKTLLYFFLKIPIYLFAIPLIILIRLMKPWFLIRWDILTSSRIGHFATDSELYLCRLEAKINIPKQKYIDIFFLSSEWICNNQLEKMLRRSLLIFPSFLMFPLWKTNRFLNSFIKGGEHHEIGINPDEDRDIYNIVHKYKPHINFSESEELKGRKILDQLGIPETAKIVCLIVRDSAYLNRYKELTARDFNYHNFRDGDIDNYLLAAEELTKRGYYVFRMGLKVLKPLKASNPKIFDYANSKVRSDFMDIYLGAKCTFCISTALGYDAIPFVFRKPIAFVFMPFGHMRVDSEKDLLITKHFLNKKSRKELTISEIFDTGVALAFHSEEYEKKGVELKENTPEEIKDFVIEMEERISGKWKETQEDLILQKKFWHIFEKNIKKLNLENSMYGMKKRSKFSSTYLKNNQDWIK